MNEKRKKLDTTRVRFIITERVMSIFVLISTAFILYKYRPR